MLASIMLHTMKNTTCTKGFCSNLDFHLIYRDGHSSVSRSNTTITVQSLSAYHEAVFMLKFITDHSDRHFQQQILHNNHFNFLRHSPTSRIRCHAGCDSEKLFFTQNEKNHQNTFDFYHTRNDKADNIRVKSG